MCWKFWKVISLTTVVLWPGLQITITLCHLIAVLRKPNATFELFGKQSLYKLMYMCNLIKCMHVTDSSSKWTYLPLLLESIAVKCAFFFSSQTAHSRRLDQPSSLMSNLCSLRRKNRGSYRRTLFQCLLRFGTLPSPLSLSSIAFTLKITSSLIIELKSPFFR